MTINEYEGKEYESQEDPQLVDTMTTCTHSMAKNQEIQIRCKHCGKIDEVIDDRKRMLKAIDAEIYKISKMEDANEDYLIGLAQGLLNAKRIINQETEK